MTEPHASSEPAKSEKQIPFAAKLRRLQKTAHGDSSERGEARKMLAHLRHGAVDLGSPRVYAALFTKQPFLYRQSLVTAEADEEDVSLYVWVASLFGIYAQGRAQSPGFDDVPKGRRRSPSLGLSAQLLRRKLKNGADSLDVRFNALVDSRPDDLFVRLRHLVRLMRSHDVPLDFGTLFTDLQQWHGSSDARRAVRRRWTEDYWRPLKEANEQAD